MNPVIQAGTNAAIVVYMEGSGGDPLLGDPSGDSLLGDAALPKSDPNIPCDFGSPFCEPLCEPLCDCDPVCDPVWEPLWDSDPICDLDFDFDGEDIRVSDSRKLLNGDEGFESRFIKYPDII